MITISKTTSTALALCVTIVPPLSAAPQPEPVVELEQEVYRYESAHNGAGPMWCSGSTCLVRIGDRVFATGLETIPDAKPLNNCRWTLFEGKDTGWERIYADGGRTREPSPIAGFANGSIIVSGNPTDGQQAEPNGGSATPELLMFESKQPEAEPVRLLPEWQGSPPFREHSYRSLATDRENGELILFQNIGYAHAEWTFRDATGKWSARGQIKWPWGADYEKPKPVRLCYPNVALKNRAVHFFGVGDITEPVEAWRLHKKAESGREWDYVFRRLFYTWSPDITKAPFGEWIEIANLDATAGHLSPCDLWIAPDDAVHLLWTEQAFDSRIQEKFFPGTEQWLALKYAVIRAGQTVMEKTLTKATNQAQERVPSKARFHITPDQRLFVVGTRIVKTRHANSIAEILRDGSLQPWIEIPLETPFGSFFTTTPRAGSSPSNTLEMLGTLSGVGNAIGYARVRLF